MPGHAMKQMAYVAFMNVLDVFFSSDSWPFVAGWAEGLRLRVS